MNLAEPVGAVADLRRYPVKSMLGEALVEAHVSPRGLAGDRTHALVDQATGKVASAKHPRLWRALLTLAAEHTQHAGDGDVRILLPDGTAVLSSCPTVDAVLSGLLGRPVTLTTTPPARAELERARPDEVLRQGLDAEVTVDTGRLAGAAPAGTLFDYAPLHLLTTATLDRIAAATPSGHIQAARYRPNIVLGTTGLEGFAENTWVGWRLRIGEQVTLRILVATPRCAVPTLAHGRLPPDPAAMRVLAAHNRTLVPGVGLAATAGVYADVLIPGRVRCGDPVRLLPATPEPQPAPA
jgi:uncharacterized protein YcbX